ncbi:Sex hormone-binding globulin [Heterocephalus glaber]|uniref:Sex hormone-binding globulin n=1 Tax=Heterocephalus glaber TaxID=10181 RepID=G5B5D4_HETGA|nr:Sex hormone-binding globulin [Heterocephalus glaber]
MRLPTPIHSSVFEPQIGLQVTMESRGPPATSYWLLLLLLLLLLSPPYIHQGWALGHILSTQRAQDPPSRYLSSGPGQGPVAVMTFDFTKITKTSSSFEFRAWDPEGVIFYGDTDTEEDWFMLGLRDGRLEIQLHNHWGQLTVGVGPRLDEGKWHQVEVKIVGDSVLLWVDGDEMLCLRQVYGPLADQPKPLMRIVLGGLKLAASTVVLKQGSKTEVFAMLPEDLAPVLKLWTQLQGRLFLGALPGEDSSASFCLNGLWVQGQKLDMDWALSRS